MSLTWDPSLALTTGSSTHLEESLVWCSTDELGTPLHPVCVHTLLVLPFVNLFSFQHSPLYGYFTCACKATLGFLFCSSHQIPGQYLVLNVLHFQPWFLILIFFFHGNLQSYNQQPINQQTRCVQITFSVTLLNLSDAVLALCLRVCQWSLV